MALPWERWADEYAAALARHADEPSPVRQALRAGAAVLAAWGSGAVAPRGHSPLGLLRDERPPWEAADVWWGVLQAAPDTGWEPDVYTLLRVCRGEYVAALSATRDVAAAVARAEARWDSLSSALHPGVYPATPGETLRRIERRLEEIGALRAHADALLRAEVVADPARAAAVAAQLYALRELEFDQERRWIEQLREALDGARPVPVGTAYSYVDPVRAPVPEVETDPFTFASDAPARAPARGAAAAAVGSSQGERDPFDFG